MVNDLFSVRFLYYHNPLYAMSVFSVMIRSKPILSTEDEPTFNNPLGSRTQYYV